MSNKSAWDISQIKEESSYKILEYLAEQSRNLSDETNGAVCADITKASLSLMDTFAMIAEKITGKREEYYYHVPKNGAKDASNLYTKTTYEFIVFDRNHGYELSLFQFTCNDSLPGTLVAEPEIALEAKLSKEVEINTLDEFVEVFSCIVHTPKVRYIISRLMLMSDKMETNSDQDDACRCTDQ